MPRIGTEPARREALISAAINMIGESGSTDVTVKQIATKADIILLSSKVAKLEAKLARIPNTFNNRRRTEQLKEEILAMHYQLTMLTADLSN